MSFKAQLLTRLISLGWVGFVFYLGSLPRKPWVPLVPRGYVDPLSHFGTFFILGALLYTCFSSGQSGFTGRVRTLFSLMAISALVALAIEALQYILPVRSAQFSDFLISMAGAACGGGLLFVLDLLRVRLSVLTAGTIGIAGIAVGLLMASVIIWNPSYPRVGDHWHARYEIVICGEKIPPFPVSPGGVHSHGNELIHVHPLRNEDAGANANLGLFLATSGGKLTENSLTLPSGQTYADGDRCPNGEIGELVVVANGIKVSKPSRYVLRRNDQIVIMFQIVSNTPRPIR